MAAMMIDIFQDKLATPMKNAINRLLPSPLELRHKILTKGKRLEEQQMEEEEKDDDDEDDEDETPSTPNVPEAPSKKPPKKVHLKVHRDLSAITYLGTGKVKAFTAEVSGNIPCDMMASYSEGAVAKNLKSQEKTAGWINHNKSHLRYFLLSFNIIPSNDYLLVRVCGGGILAAFIQKELALILRTMYLFQHGPPVISWSLLIIKQGI